MMHLNDNADRSFMEYVEMYEAKTKDKFNPSNSYELVYLPNRGFCEYKIDQEHKFVYINHLCGDLRFWADMAHGLVQMFHLNGVASIFLRDNPNAKAYIRLLGYRIVEKQELKDEFTGETLYSYKIRNKEGLCGRFTPCRNYYPEDKNRLVYMITFGVKNYEDKI